MSRHCAEYDVEMKEWKRRPLTPAEEAQRDVDDAEWQAQLLNPPPKPRDLAEEVDALKAEIAVLKKAGTP